LLGAAGCAGFRPPTRSDLEKLDLPERPASPGYERLRIQMSIDSASLAGEFDGALLVRRDQSGPVVRLNLFGDLGPKMIDLMARRDRIVGYFPQTREAVDCALPREAAPHPLVFMGATLVERFSEVSKSRVIGVREADEGRWWLDLRPAIEGMTTRVLWSRHDGVRESRFSWMYGLGWREEWSDPRSAIVRAAGISIRVRILEESTSTLLANPGVMDLALPSDAHIVRGSRK
jgi:hypothetical protein